MVEKNKILVINAGSSSIKFQIFVCNKNKKKINFNILCKGLIERISIKNSNFIIEIANNEQKFIKYEIKKNIINHVVGAKLIIDSLINYKIINDFNDIKYIGHRVVHGGQKFKNSVIINKKVIIEIKKFIKLAPLHNPACLKGLSSFQKIIPNAKHVAVFDTSFHNTIPKEKYLYSVPYTWYKKYEVKKYGFHGISYQYILNKLSDILNKKKETINTIICHLGNGASICAIKKGKSFNTSMGLTPLDGLIMGSRSGIIDPSIHYYISNVNKNATIETINNDLNKYSGLLGISEYSSDLRDIIECSNNKKNKNYLKSLLAIKMFVQRIANYIVQYANDLEKKIDALVFTAGIGENSAIIRKLIIKEIKLINFKLTKKNNEKKYNDYLKISNKKSEISIFKIRTNEELMICQDTYKLLKK